eukprot:982044_1
MAEQSGSPNIFKPLSPKQNIAKHITIYNQSDVHIKVIATERHIKKEENRQEIERDINTTSHPQNDEHKTAQNRNISTSSDSPNDSEHNTKLEGTVKAHE